VLKDRKPVQLPKALLPKVLQQKVKNKSKSYEKVET